MSQIRKGSIVWDRNNERKSKVLTSPSKGEVPDKIFLITGNRYSKRMREQGIVLIAWEEGLIEHNNIPCHLARMEQLIPFKEYLKERSETISLSHIRENYTEFN